MTQATIDLIKQLIAQNQANVTAFTEILPLAETGWQTDQAAIDAGIKVGVDAAVAAAVIPLNDQIATLTAEKADLQARLDAAPLLELTPPV